MEMIRIPNKEIQEELFCIDSDLDFADMLEKVLGYEVGQYARNLALAFEEADAYVETLYKENKKIEKQLNESHHTFTFMFPENEVMQC